MCYSGQCKLAARRCRSLLIFPGSVNVVQPSSTEEIMTESIVDPIKVTLLDFGKLLERGFDHFVEFDFCTGPHTKFWIFAADWNLDEDLAGTDEFDSEERVHASHEFAEVVAR